jgi:hypothetical protein
VLVVSDRALSAREKGGTLARAVLPIVAATVAFALAHRGWEHGGIGAEGGVILPAAAHYGVAFLALNALGLAVATRDPVARVPVVFAGAALLQAAMFWWLAGTPYGSRYLAAKTFHLILYPQVMLVALGIAAAWQAASQPLSPAFRRRLSLAVPLLAAALLPFRRPWIPQSIVTEPLVRAGEWAKSHLPRACVDYGVPQPTTAYWLHVAVLGNPREWERTSRLLEDFPAYQADVRQRRSPSIQRWAIVADVDEFRRSADGTVRVLFRDGPAAVVERGRAARCSMTPAPIDRLALPDDRPLARLLGENAAGAD